MWIYGILLFYHLFLFNIVATSTKTTTSAPFCHSTEMIDYSRRDPRCCFKFSTLSSYPEIEECITIMNDPINYLCVEEDGQQIVSMEIVKGREYCNHVMHIGFLMGEGLTPENMIPFLDYLQSFWTTDQSSGCGYFSKILNSKPILWKVVTYQLPDLSLIDFANICSECAACLSDTYLLTELTFAVVNANSQRTREILSGCTRIEIMDKRFMCAVAINSTTEHFMDLCEAGKDPGYECLINQPPTTVTITTDTTTVPSTTREITTTGSSTVPSTIITTVEPTNESSTVASTTTTGKVVTTGTSEAPTISSTSMASTTTIERIETSTSSSSVSITSSYVASSTPSTTTDTSTIPSTSTTPTSSSTSSTTSTTLSTKFSPLYTAVSGVSSSSSHFPAFSSVIISSTPSSTSISPSSSTVTSSTPSSTSFSTTTTTTSTTPSSSPLVTSPHSHKDSSTSSSVSTRAKEGMALFLVVLLSSVGLIIFVAMCVGVQLYTGKKNRKSEGTVVSPVSPFTSTPITPLPSASREREIGAVPSKEVIVKESRSKEGGGGSNV